MVATELDLCSVRDGERWWPPTIEHKKARLQMPYLCRKPLGPTKYQNHHQGHLSTCPSQTRNYAVKSDLFFKVRAVTRPVLGFGVDLELLATQKIHPEGLVQNRAQKSYDFASRQLPDSS